ncbi:MAG: VWA domain-containing protein [Gammaproteobacteria bacterium]|nr:VWA domain-containing protein [Gammaproteobacteria bacterium]
MWGTLALPWLVRRFVPPADDGPAVALRAPLPLAASALTQTASTGAISRGGTRAVLLALLWLLLVAASARPQWLAEPIEIRESSRDLLLAVDLSRSMGEQDFELGGQPASRLRLVKRVAAEFVRRREGDRVGLILFGARAYLQTPLTFDRATVATMLEEAQIGIAGNETAIGDAIGLAVKRLRHSTTKKVLLLLTDGANTGGAVAPLQATLLARQVGLRIHTVGLGSPVTREPDTRLRVFQFNATADLDETVLMRIAEQTGGRYFRASDRAALERVYQSIDALEPREQKGRKVQPRLELYRWPLALALLFAIAVALKQRRETIAVSPPERVQP